MDSTRPPLICIPFGITFYAVKNLDFAAYAEMRPSAMILAALIVFVYFTTILVLGWLLKQKRPDHLFDGRRFGHLRGLCDRDYLAGR